PAIAPYPFTTQELMLSYYEYEGVKYQVIDTPGLLDRPLTERKPAELHAILALTHLASLIIFLTDPTEICGYTLADQEKLFSTIKTEFKQPGIFVINKADIKEQPQTKGVINISADKGTGIEELKKKIKEKIDKITPVEVPVIPQETTDSAEELTEEE
ncbi:MAG: GTPase, partial [Candidatus Woesearchaeota archaeon]|nr:GTPase [Candidatus Woesearchaeota archaeon]